MFSAVWPTDRGWDAVTAERSLWAYSQPAGTSSSRDRGLRLGKHAPRLQQHGAGQHLPRVAEQQLSWGTSQLGPLIHYPEFPVELLFRLWLSVPRKSGRSAWPAGLGSTCLRSSTSTLEPLTRGPPGGRAKEQREYGHEKQPPGPQEDHIRGAQWAEHEQEHQHHISDIQRLPPILHIDPRVPVPGPTHTHTHSYRLRDCQIADRHLGSAKWHSNLLVPTRFVSLSPDFSHMQWVRNRSTLLRSIAILSVHDR